MELKGTGKLTRQSRIDLLQCVSTALLLTTAQGRDNALSVQFTTCNWPNDYLRELHGVNVIVKEVASLRASTVVLETLSALALPHPIYSAFLYKLSRATPQSPGEPAPSVPKGNTIFSLTGTSLSNRIKPACRWRSTRLVRMRSLLTRRTSICPELASKSALSPPQNAPKLKCLLGNLNWPRLHPTKEHAGSGWTSLLGSWELTERAAAARNRTDSNSPPTGPRCESAWTHGNGASVRLEMAESTTTP